MLEEWQVSLSFDHLAIPRQAVDRCVCVCAATAAKG